MAMASSLFFSTPIPTKLISKQKPFYYHSSNPISPQLTHKHSRTLVVSSAAAIEAETQTSNSATTPSKSLPFRVGHGFDLHRLEPGYPLIIGGINIPHDRGCEAHSDGDVLLHCVVDAILGALGLPDIGQIFPDTDPKWKGAPSSVFIEEANTRYVILAHITDLNPDADKSLIFKWRRVEGQTNYPSSFRPCATGPQRFLDYEKEVLHSTPFLSPLISDSSLAASGLFNLLC